MGTSKTMNLPMQLEGTRRRIEQWRRTRKGRSPIPEGLWALAVKAAGKYGLNPTARALRLDYYSLKKRVEAADSCRVSEGKVVSANRKAVATFVELASPAPASTRECILELEDPCGSKMRVHLKGVEAPDLAALSRSFWGTGGSRGNECDGRSLPKGTGWSRS